MIVYASRTGNVRYIIDEKLKDLPSIKIEKNMVVNQPYFLFTYTDGIGNVPEEVLDFLKNSNNVENLKAVIASGNTNFGEYFCKSADNISKKYNVPIVKKIDLRGNSSDYIDIIDSYNNLIGGI